MEDKNSTIWMDCSKHSSEELLALKSSTDLQLSYPKNEHIRVLGNFNQLTKLHLHQAKARDYTDLKRLTKLTHLKAQAGYGQKDFSFIGALSSLPSLDLSGISGPSDFAWFQKMEALRELRLSGSFSGDLIVESLSFLADLTELETLILQGIRVRDGSLEPISKLKHLRTLWLPDLFETNEYIKLKIALPDTSCERFVPWYSPGIKNISGEDLFVGQVKVVGKRKPFLNLPEQKQKLQKYIDAWDKRETEIRNRTKPSSQRANARG